MSYQKQFAVTVNNLTENQTTPPTDISLSSTSVNENVAAGTVIGNFISTSFSLTSFTYILVSSIGNADNNAFTIDGSSLQINASPDYTTKSIYSIRVQKLDGNNWSYQKQFAVTVNDLKENITAPMISLFGSGNALVSSGSRIDK